ncbi:hypothetical protein K2173_015171 [Erythroxylum novogranatense]|uniref:Uncharacterized protein n=1 Tax=Erythroxylum novogranatense TaxID=1862640 RepID=A0AAV8T295_9ROSI|nr:hypothetical protein K2173_015171 [Erythroxylum novogranatense]
MAKHKSIMYALVLGSSLCLNLLYVARDRWDWDQSWVSEAAEEAEAVASISCSGHGRAYPDGLIVEGLPVCECNDCYRGPDCSEFVPDCVVDADSGDPMFLEPFWMKHAASSTIVVPAWHRMSYEFNDGSLISEELKNQILKLHDIIRNANTSGRHIIFGAGATQLLNAAVYALSHDDDPSEARVVASAPYYPVYKEQTELFDSEDFEFSGDTSSWKNDYDPLHSYIELVTSPNNPDGKLRKAVLQGQSVHFIHDLAYYWPHFTAIPAPADENLVLFTLSKLTGHAGSRFGWALVKDEAVYQRMLTYMSLSTYGVPRETQLRVLKLLKVVIEEGEGREIFEFGFQIMSKRWEDIHRIISMSKRFSLQDIGPQFCSFNQGVREASPAFAWLKCEKEEDMDCYNVLKASKIIGREGVMFGAESRFVRLSLVKSQDDFNLLLQRIEKMVRQESNIILEENNEAPTSRNGSCAVNVDHFVGS